MKGIKNIYIGILLFFLLGCNNPNLPSKNSLKLKDTSKNFGRIQTNQKIDFSICLINNAATEDTILSFSKSCGCTTVKEKQIIIKANSRKYIRMSYNPKDDSGYIKKTVILRSASKNILIFRFMAIVQGEI